MKRHTILALLLTAGVLGGLFLLFPAVWVGLLVALLALITAQAVLLRRHISVVERYPPLKDKSRPTSESAAPAASAEAAPAPAAEGSSADESRPEPAGDNPASGPEPAAVPPDPVSPAAGEVPAGEAGALPDGEVFSRFRAHLEALERGPAGAGGNKAPPARAAAAAPGDGDDEDVRVDLSAAARARSPAAPSANESAKAPGKTTAPSARADRDGAAPAAAAKGAAAPSEAAPEPAGEAAAPAKPPRKRSKPAPPPEEDEDDLFADLRADHNRIAGSESPKSKPKGKAKPAGKPAEAATKAPKDEVGAALEAAEEPKALAEEGAALLQLAREAHDRGDLAGLRAGLENYEALLSGKPELIAWESDRLRLRLAVLEQKTDPVPGHYEQMWSRGYAPAEEAIEPELDPLLDGLSAAVAAELKVALLLKAMTPLRQAKNRAAMDRLYTRIEAIQEPLGDPKKLISHLKSHLSIREALDDLPGRLELIDRLGQLHFQTGDTAPAKEYYEMAVRLRAEAEGAEGGAEDGVEGTESAGSREAAPAKAGTAKSAENAEADAAPPTPEGKAAAGEEPEPAAG